MTENTQRCSILNLNANAASVLVYILSMACNFFTDLDYFTWIIPLLFLVLEKSSKYVQYHSAQALSFCLISLAINIIGMTLNLFTSSEGYDMIVSLTVMVVALSSLIFSITLLVYEFISIYTAYKYTYNKVPLVSSLAKYLLKKLGKD